MVMNDEGQLYTIEGVTAGIIMLVTAFTIFNSGIVYTPGDAHISDMQIQQLGYDALLMMDTPGEMAPLSASPLALMILNKSKINPDTEFVHSFPYYLSLGTGTTDIVDSLEYNATIYHRVTHGGVEKVQSYLFSSSPNSEVSLLTREPAISVTRYMWLPRSPTGYGASEYDNEKQLVLLEVLIWRR